MANHLRQQIRERIGTTLTGLSTTGTNVFQSRVYQLEDSNLPALLIYTNCLLHPQCFKVLEDNTNLTNSS